MRRVSGSGQMNSMPEGRDRAIEAYRLLNDFISDIVVATRTTYVLERQGFHNQAVLRGVDRMCFSHLIITLSKWAEFYDKYGHVEVTFSHYYKFVFSYNARLEDGSHIEVGYGGDAGEIYRFDLTNNEKMTVNGVYPYTGKVTKDGETIDEFYDY